ncbi:MAG: hypothetical protein HY703_11775 [Gemmatimonadetes bacterium]|nr:hypothetical protein [Gemmatimonadota bacterium]
MSVYYRCKFCGKEHPAPAFAEKMLFDMGATLEVGLECPETGKQRAYNRTDLVWREGEEPEDTR